MNASTRLLSVLLVAFTLGCPPLQAWDAHGLITETALADVAWLDSIPPVAVTSRSDTIQGIRQDYSFPFHGEDIGQTLSPRMLLIRYAAEPDWGPDQELHASWQQRFMGGYTGMSSRGYFHMYYPSWTVHFPVPAISMGAAPERALLWYEASLRAFKRGDGYWGFRYLACALHYIEDVAQPYHSTQTSSRFIVPRSPVKGTTAVTRNYHLVYEAWIGHQMRQDAFDLRQSLRGTDTVAFEGPAEGVKKVARLSHEQASDLFKACVEFYDSRFGQPRNENATEADLAQTEPAGPRRDIIAATRPALRLTGQAIRALVETARPVATFNLIHIPQSE